MRVRKTMNDLIIQSYWLLFDCIKPCLIPFPNVEIEPVMCDIPIACKTFYIMQNYTEKITFHAAINDESSSKFGFYHCMIELLCDKRNLSSCTWIFKEHGDKYEIALTILKNMILAGKITKDECIKIFSEAECHEALVELLQFDMEENQAERFDL